MSSDEFDAWLQAHGSSEPDVVVAIFNRASANRRMTDAGRATLPEDLEDPQA